jgi:hypothetical protein
MRHAVSIEFDRCIRKICRKLKEHSREEILKALLEHDRKGACIDHTCEAIRVAESRANIGGKFEISRFRLFIETTAGMFCNAALTHFKEQAISQAEKQRRIDDANRMANIEAEFEADQAEALDSRIRSYPGAPARSNA